jgi:nucleoside-diphosphate-sugar epimerase
MASVFLKCILVLVFVSFTVALKRVLVTGATGRVGRLVITELLAKDDVTVKALVRNVQKAKEVLPDDSRLEVLKCDLGNVQELKKQCKDCDAAIWAATGFSDAMSPVDKLFGAFKLKFQPKVSIDIAGVAAVGEALSGSSGVLPEGDGPNVVICSSAGVTRPTWSDEKKLRFVGAADIPIVRLNPLNILGIKREAEESVRRSEARYCILRPTGLNDKWPQGRPVFSQGDLAVGRISRGDTAKVLADLLFEPKCVGKTIECFSLSGYPTPFSYESQLQRLRADTEGPISEDALEGQYALLQQMVPGETLAPNQLAMGQSYEQLDKGETGRLGKRGTEEAPIVRTA